MLIALVSGRGAPGVTTSALALALAWPRPVLLAECDPRGGDVLWGYGQGRDAAGRGLLGLQVAVRHLPMSAALWSQVVELQPPPGLQSQIRLLPGVAEPRQAAAVGWAQLGSALARLGDVDVIADCGTTPALSAPSAVWAAADLVVVITRATLRGTRAAQIAAAALRADLQTTGFGTDRLVSVVVGAGHPYSLAEVSAAMAGPAAVRGALPWDPRAAQVLSDGAPAAGRLRRSALLRAAAGLARALGAEALDNAAAGAAVADSSTAWGGRAPAGRGGRLGAARLGVGPLGRC